MNTTICGWGDLRSLNRTWCPAGPAWGSWDLAGVILIASESQRGEQNRSWSRHCTGKARYDRDTPYDSFSKFIFLITRISFLSKVWNYTGSLLAAITSCVSTNSSQTLYRHIDADTGGKKTLGGENTRLKFLITAMKILLLS